MDGLDAQLGVSVLWGLVKKKGAVHSGGCSFNFALALSPAFFEAGLQEGNHPTRHKTYSFRQLGSSWDPPTQILSPG